MTRRQTLGGLGLLLAAGGLVYWQAALAGVDGSGTYAFFRPVGRAGLSVLALFGLCGYGPTALLAPPAWRRHALLLTLPVGAACSTLALTLLGVAHVPFDVSLAVVLGAGAAITVCALVRGPRVRPDWGLTALGLGAAFVVGVLAMMPAMRAGFPTVQGSNGDSILAVGTADFLSHATPGEVRPELALDRVPLVWNSKLPIYYGLAAVARLSNQDEIMAFSSVGGVVLGMFALGLLLFALHALRAPPLVALLAALLVPLSRGVVHVAIHTYYNQLWATFALPFVLLAGWQLVRRPSRPTAALFALFFALALFTYPLLLPFPLVFLAVLAWPERARIRALLARRRTLPRAARWSAYVVAVVAALYALQGVIEKIAPAANALLPWGDLTGYGGGLTLPYLPVGRFFGLETASLPLQLLILAALAGLLVYGLRETGDRVAGALATLLAGAMVTTLYLRLRSDGELFYFKNLSFAATLVLAVVVVGLGRLLLAGRAGAVAAVAALGAMSFGLFDGARREIAATYELGSVNVLEIREWAREIPTSDTIRIDTEEGAWQLWSWYLLSNHRVSASRPLYGFFPHPPRGFAAEWSLTRKPYVPPDRVGGPVYENREFAMYRIRPNPHPNSSSQTLVWDVKEISYGF